MEPDIGQFPNGTKFIICGVQWSLAYEWMFYCSLALIGGAFFRLKPSLITLFLATVFLVVFALIIHSYYPNRLWWRLCPFLSGLAAAFVARNEKAGKFFSHIWATPILLALGYIAIFVYPLIFALVPMLCMTLVFIGLACGNDLFGLLNWKPCRQLGQISYSIYLLHGLVLFTVFYFVLGFGEAASFSIIQHWLTICVCCIFVVFLCSFSYCYIEKPGIDSAGIVIRKIRSLLGAKRSPVIPALWTLSGHNAFENRTRIFWFRPLTKANLIKRYINAIAFWFPTWILTSEFFYSCLSG